MLAAVWMLLPREPSGPRWQSILFYVAAVQFVLGAAALAAAPILAPIYYGGGDTWWLIALAALAALLSLIALIAYLRTLKVLAFAFAALSVFVAYPTLTTGAAPRLSRLWVSPRAAALIAKYAKPGDPPPIAAGYTEPSLKFALGTETRLTDGHGAADVGAYQGGLALIEDSERPAFLAHLAEIEADAVPLDGIDGFNYTRGRPVHITLYRVTATHDVMVPPAE
jgi:hypothetical protein